MTNSREKGKRGEREWASVCRGEGFPQARRGQQFCGKNGDADVVGLPGVHVEVKRTERFNGYDALAQARRDAKDGALPIVAHRRNDHPWLVVMYAEDWFKLYREFFQDAAAREAEKQCAACGTMVMDHLNLNACPCCGGREWKEETDDES